MSLDKRTDVGDCRPFDPELGAKLEWNSGADEYNQWDSLGQDEKDELIKTYTSNNRRGDGVRLLETQDIPKGTEVLIPKGTSWGSTHPTRDHGVTKRDIRLKVQIASPKVTTDLVWAGTGGYWRWCPKVDCFYFPNVDGLLNTEKGIE